MIGGEMNALDRTQAAVRAEKVDRLLCFPILIAHACKLTGTRQGEYSQNPEAMAQAPSEAVSVHVEDSVGGRDHTLAHRGGRHRQISRPRRSAVARRPSPRPNSATSNSTRRHRIDDGSGRQQDAPCRVQRSQEQPSLHTHPQLIRDLYSCPRLVLTYYRLSIRLPEQLPVDIRLPPHFSRISTHVEAEGVPEDACQPRYRAMGSRGL